MYRIVVPLLSLFYLSASLTAQVVEEPYPAPVSFQDLTEQQATFIALFEDRNVGNLHLFIPPSVGTQPTFDGTIIPKSYRRLFPKSVRRSFKRKGQQPVALHSIRGDEEDWYLVRTYDRKGTPAIRLYEWENGKMKEKMVLAYTRCQAGQCEQLDSWIRDINGDTTLDIVQKREVRSKNGKTLQSDLAAYSIDRRGQFVVDNTLSIDAGDYSLERMGTR